MTLPAVVRSGLRALLRRPGYALLTLSTLALAVGGSTAVFALVDGVLLRSVPFPEPERLVTLDIESARTGYGISLSVPNYRDLRDRTRVFDAFGASAGDDLVLRTDEGSRPVEGRMVLGDFFSMLGLEAGVGRVLSAGETEAGAEPVAVLGHGYWMRTTGGDPGIVGRTLVLDGVPHAVVGVLEPGRGYPSPEVEVYTPMGARSGSLPWDDRDSSFGTRALARLAPGVDVEAAGADVVRVTGEIDALSGRPMIRARVVGLDAFFLGEARRGVGILMGAVLLLLLVAGANVANLALARSEERGRELAVRTALGAGRDDLTRLLVAEALLLAAAGGAAGLVLAHLAVGSVQELLPVELPALVQGRIGVGGPAILFAAAVSAGCGLLFGLAPALGAVGRAGPGMLARLRQGRGSGSGPGARRLREGLVVGQAALSVVLLVGAGLLLASLDALLGVDKGFRADGVLTASLQAPRGTFAGADEWLAFNDGVVEGLVAEPGVERAALSLLLPLSGSSWERRIWPEGTPVEVEAASSVLFNVVSEDYFQLLGIPLLAGRSFRRADTGEAPPVAVVDETMARRYWPGEEAVGRRITLGESDGAGETVWREVVGVVANTRHYELESPSRIQVYIPMRQPGPLAGIGMAVLASVPGGGAGAATERLRSLVAELEPGVPVAQVRMLEGYVGDALGATRALGSVTALFGAVATLLAGLGVFGVLSLVVARRRRELGVRMSLGAAPLALVGLVLGRSLLLVGVGAGVGMAVSLLAGGLLQDFLFQVDPGELRIHALAVGGLGIAVLLAAVRPALLATRTDPASVLRQD